MHLKTAFFYLTYSKLHFHIYGVEVGLGDVHLQAFMDVMNNRSFTAALFSKAPAFFNNGFYFTLVGHK